MAKLARKSIGKPRNSAQAKRFIEAAHEAGASEDEAVFRENLKRLAKAKPKSEPKART
jgi:hypothetical protein